jgi:biotin carboxylase
LCRRFRVPTIEEFSVDSDSIKYPVLVKPVDGSGSRGVVICNDEKELAEAVRVSKESSRKGKVIIERYMDCPEATVFWLFVDGKYYLTMIGNRHVKHNQSGDIVPLPVGYTFPSYLTPKYQEEVVENAKKMFQSVGVKNGIMFVQCKVENGTCYVYDIGYRLTGSREYKIQDKVCGYDTMAMLINFAITGRMCECDISEKINPCGLAPSFNVSSLCAPGTIKTIEGLDEVKGFPEVIDVVLAHYPGQTITEQMKGLLAQIAVRTIGTVSDKSSLYPMMKKIEKTIRIISDKEENLVLPGIEEKDVLNMIL